MDIVTVVGNIGRVEELKHVGSDNTAVLNLSIASNRFSKDGSATVWYRAAIWGKLAESLAPHITVGKTMAIVGTLQFDLETGGPRLYEGKNGTGASFEIKVDKIEFVGKKDDGGSSNSQADEIPF